jgi:hypothetical protein
MRGRAEWQESVNLIRGLIYLNSISSLPSTWLTSWPTFSSVGSTGIHFGWHPRTGRFVILFKERFKLRLSGMRNNRIYLGVNWVIGMILHFVDLMGSSKRSRCPGQVFGGIHIVHALDLGQYRHTYSDIIWLPLP